MENLTLEKLPQAFSQLNDTVEEIKTLLLNREVSQEKDKILSASEAAKFLKIQLPTLYSKVSRKEVRNMKRGKILYFSENELRDYLMAGSRKTKSDVEREADEFIFNRK